MKKILLMSLIGLFVTFAFAQNNNNVKTNNTNNQNVVKPNNQVKTDIKVADLKKEITDNVAKDFPGYNIDRAFKIENKEKNTVEYRVMIKKDKEQMMLIYDGDGKFVKKNEPNKDNKVRTQVKAEDLNKAITENIAKDYAGYKIENAMKIEEKGVVNSYNVIVSNEKGKLMLMYDKDGKFMNKRELGGGNRKDIQKKDNTKKDEIKK